MVRRRAGHAAAPGRERVRRPRRLGLGRGGGSLRSVSSASEGRGRPRRPVVGRRGGQRRCWRCWLGGGGRGPSPESRPPPRRPFRSRRTARGPCASRSPRRWAVGRRRRGRRRRGHCGRHTGRRARRGSCCRPPTAPARHARTCRRRTPRGTCDACTIQCRQARSQTPVETTATVESKQRAETQGREGRRRQRRRRRRDRGDHARVKGSENAPGARENGGAAWRGWWSCDGARDAKRARAERTTAPIAPAPPSSAATSCRGGGAWRAARAQVPVASWRRRPTWDHRAAANARGSHGDHFGAFGSKCEGSSRRA